MCRIMLDWIEMMTVVMYCENPVASIELCHYGARPQGYKLSNIDSSLDVRLLRVVFLMLNEVSLLVLLCNQLEYLGWNEDSK